MKFVLLFISMFFVFVSSNGQLKTSCGLVETMLCDNDVRRYFALTRYDGDLIIIVDTGNYFDRCIVPDVDGKKVVVIRSMEEKVEGRRTYIDVYRVENEKNLTTIYLGQKMSDRYGYIKVKRMHNKFKVVDRQLGHF